MHVYFGVQQLIDSQEKNFLELFQYHSARLCSLEWIEELIFLTQKKWISLDTEELRSHSAVLGSWRHTFIHYHYCYRYLHSITFLIVENENEFSSLKSTFILITYISLLSPGKSNNIGHNQIEKCQVKREYVSILLKFSNLWP